MTVTSHHLDLLDAIAELTNPQRQDGHTLLSVWDRLVAAVDTMTGTGSSAHKSKPPVAIAAVSLIDAVERECAAGLADLGLLQSRRRGRRDIPKELRSINTVVMADPPLRDWWRDLVLVWRDRAVAITEQTDRLTHLRGFRCLDCKAAEVFVEDDGGDTIKQPALRLIWRETSIDRVWCAACGSGRWPVDLLAIAEQVNAANTTHETLAHPVLG